MDDRKKVLVEGELYAAITAFHDCDDKKRREEFVKEYTLKFCKKYNIDVEEALDLVINMINQRRKNSDYQYEQYKDLKKLVIPQGEEIKDRRNSRNKSEDPASDSR